MTTATKTSSTATAPGGTEPARIEGVRSRTVRWTDPGRVRFRLRGLDGYEQLAAMKRDDAAAPPAVALLGLSLDELERGRTVFSVVADERHENPMGTMHGGIVATLVDTAMGCAVSSTLPADAGFTTLELSTNFVRAITQSTGRVYAEGRVVHGGGRVITTEARVYDDAGTLYAHAKSTCLIQRRTR
ncbi:MAG: hypothetical protein QOG65_3082 [Actinomycetota bacterium]|jgi:uncharacterized protein (TIGR00369 family)|nr:hypothetical protein [Actinomycetota bacterium]